MQPLHNLSVILYNIASCDVKLFVAATPISGPQFNPITNDLKCFIHFEFKDKSSINKAFIYDWRLWSLPEIKECLLESGFKQVDIYMQGWDDEKDEETDDFYKTKTCDADPGWLAYIIATKQ